MILLPTTYFGNIEYFSALISGEPIVIEAYESFPKQTYRNRAIILSANGPIPLIVPVLHNHGKKTLTADTLIDNSMPWQRNAWRAITSAYRNSPYFEHYESLVEPLFTKRYDSLLEMNDRAMNAMLKAIYVSPEINYSTEYRTIEEFTEGVRDLRESFNPKKENPNRINRPYYQVFTDRMGFIPNLSILDLLFCEGTNTQTILKK